jgi:hypothetical protein
VRKPAREKTPWPQRCACGVEWTRAAWKKLRVVGEWRDEDGRTYELRQCTCRSTMTVEVRVAITS